MLAKLGAYLFTGRFGETNILCPKYVILTKNGNEIETLDSDKGPNPIFCTKY